MPSKFIRAWGSRSPHPGETDPLISPGATLPTTSCPTCGGSGQVRRDFEHEYIALIPLTDHRLRPRRTIIKLAGAVLLCMAASGFFLFFLFPRSIRLSSNAPLILPADVEISKSDVVTLNITNLFNFTNENFVPVSIRNVSVLSTYHMIVINTTFKDLDTWVGPRSSHQFGIPLILTFTADSFIPYLARLCQMDNAAFNRIYMDFAFSVVAFSLGQRIETSLVTVQFVGCHPPVSSTTSDFSTTSSPTTLPSDD